MFDELKEVLFSENTEAHKGLKCNLCNKCLSTAPILHNSVYGNVCGRTRCNNLACTKGENTEQLAYESVAKYLIFPCMYRDNGCQKELKWGEVHEHELLCDYKKLPCPFWQNDFPIHDKEECEWKGSCYRLLTHIEENHLHRIASHDFTIPIRQNFNAYLGEVIFTKIANNIVAILFRINNQKTALFCRIWGSFHIYKDLKYRIRILDENPKESIALRKKNVELLCPNFMTEGTVEKWSKIDLNYIKDFLNSPHAIAIEFEYNDVKLSSYETHEDVSETKEFYDIGLRAVKCDSCRKELTPPVYLCLLAHNICFSCRKSEICPRCSSKLSNSRNIAYEKLKFSVQQPCANYSKGCTFKDTYPNIESHEQICPLNLRQCILKCSKKEVELLSHLKLDHILSMSQLNVLYDMNRLSIHIFQFDEQIFLFKKSLVIGEGFSYTVQCLGVRDVRYKYKLHLINDRFTASEIVLCQICHPELLDFSTLETDQIKGLSNVITISQDVLEQVLPDLRNLKFKISLYKIGAAAD